MRIHDVNRAPGAQKAEPAVQKPRGEKEGGSGGSTGAKQAGVSELAQALTSSDPERLEQLRLAVQYGNYDVPAEAVAKAIVDHHTAD
jgi:anti-sigma28 factor (negative regulator of flagellin synthesis)